MIESSLFRRLFLSIFLMLILLFALGTWLVLHSTGKQIDADYDAQLIADSHTVWTLVREDLEEGDDLGELHLDFNAPMLNAEDRETLTHYARWRAVRIWKDKKLAAQSENVKSISLPKMNPGFSDHVFDDQLWRIYTVFVPENHITVEVWENLHNRHRLMLSIAEGMLEPGVIILPVLILLLMLSIRYGIRSVLIVAHHVKARRPDDLSPIVIEKFPREIAPLYRAINMLLEKVRNSVAHERQFMDNVAHELKTPLAALRLQGELIAKAPTESQRQECVDDLIKGIDRATHLFDQILLFSRLTHNFSDNKITSAVPVIQDVISQRINIALSKQIEISLDADEAVTLHTNPELLHVLLGALLDNALKYTPSGGKIYFELRDSTLSITDTGPGIPEEEHAHVFERFARGKTGGAEGSGLGLSIVREICTLQHIDIELSHPASGSGLRVILKFRSEI